PHDAEVVATDIEPTDVITHDEQNVSAYPSRPSRSSNDLGRGHPTFAAPRSGVITALQGWGLNIAASLLLLMRHRGRIGRAVQPVHRWQRAYASACRLPVLMIVSSRRLHYTGDVIQAARYTGSSAPLI